MSNRTGSPLTTIATALMGMTVLVHIFLGGPEVNEPLNSSELPDFLRAFATILLHAVTVVLTALTFGLIMLRNRPDFALETMVSGIQVGFAALLIWYGSARLGTVWLMPQWVIFTIIPIITRLGQHGRS